MASEHRPRNSKVKSLIGWCVALAIIAWCILAILPAGKSGPHARGVSNERVLDSIESAIAFPGELGWLWIARPLLVNAVTDLKSDLQPAIALAGLITCDGHIEPAWQLARTSPSRLIALAESMQHLPDAAMRIELYHYLLSLAASDAPPIDVTCNIDDWPTVRAAALRGMALVPARDDEVERLCALMGRESQFSAAVADARAKLAEPRELFVRDFTRKYATDDVGNVLSEDSRASLPRGRRLFHELSCHKCHNVSGPSSPLGPSLAAATFRDDPQVIYKSIVKPDAEVAVVYREHLLIVGGKVLTGSLIESADNYVVIVTDPLGDCEPMKIARDELEEPPSELKSSPMPNGMADGLTVAELRDLVMFVAARGQMDGWP